MPSLTLRTNRQAQTDSEPRQPRQETTQRRSSERRAEPEPSVESTTPSAERTQERRVTSEQRVDEPPAGTNSRPPEGRETSALYPDLSAKTLAPRVDVTHRDRRTQDITHRRTERSGQERPPGQQRELSTSLGGPESEASALSADVDRVVDMLYRELERKMRTERERRGL